MSKRLTNDVARVVRGILAQRQITNKDFAAAMGEPNTSVARWLNEGGTFSTDKLDPMAEALGMDAEHLVHLALLSRTVSDGEMSALLESVSSRINPAARSSTSRRRGKSQTG